MSSTRKKGRAIFLAALMVLSVVGAGVAFTGSAAAQQQTTPTEEVVVDADFSENNETAGEYTSIQAAIDAEGSDTLINVTAGTYNETVKIGESGGIDNVTIQGAGAGESIINGTEGARTIEIGRISGGDNIQASNLSISGFTINQNTTTSFAIESATNAETHENITIQNNLIVANGSQDGTGVYLPNAIDVSIVENEFATEEDGVTEHISGNADSQQFTIEENTFKGDLARPDQTGEGNAIELRGSDATVTDNDFNVSSDGSAIYVTADDVTIENNDLDGDYNLSDGRYSGVPAIETATALSNLNVNGNQITNYYAGVQLYGADGPATVTDARIVSNTIENAYFGIGQAGDDGTQIVGNDISAQVQGVSGWNVDNMVVGDNTITVNNSTISDANQADDPFIGNERGIGVSGNNVTITGNRIISINTAVLVGSGAGQDVVVSQNNLLGDEYGVDASAYDADSHGDLDATLNWWGNSAGPNAEAGSNVSENVKYDPFLTTEVNNLDVDDARDTTQFAHELAVESNQPTAVGFPGPTDQTVSEAFSELEKADGASVIYRWTDEGWQSLDETDGDNEIDALDAFVVVTKADGAVVSVEYADTGDTATAPSAKTLNQGFNFVAPAIQGPANHSDTFNLQDDEALYNLFASPGSLGTNEFQGQGAYPGDDKVSPFMGYFVHVPDGDRSHRAMVTTGVTAGEIEGTLNISS